MSFLSQFASFLFEKPTERIIDDNTFMDALNRQWTALMRKDVDKSFIKYEIQTYFREKEYRVYHTGPSTISVVFFTEDGDDLEKSSLLFAISITTKGERVLTAKYNSQDPESFQLFGDLMQEFGERIAESKLFKSQENEAFTTPENYLVLISDPETVSVQQQELIQESIIHNQLEGIYVAFLSNDADRTKIMFNLIESAKKAGFTVERPQKATILIYIKGQTGKLELKLGLNKAGERILQGEYNGESVSSLFSAFLEAFTATLVLNGSLKAPLTLDDSGIDTNNTNDSTSTSAVTPTVSTDELPSKEKLETQEKSSIFQNTVPIRLGNNSNEGVKESNNISSHNSTFIRKNGDEDMPNLFGSTPIKNNMMMANQSSLPVKDASKVSTPIKEHTVPQTTPVDLKNQPGGRMVGVATENKPNDTLREKRVAPIKMNIQPKKLSMDEDEEGTNIFKFNFASSFSSNDDFDDSFRIAFGNVAQPEKIQIAENLKSSDDYSKINDESIQKTSEKVSLQSGQEEDDIPDFFGTKSSLSSNVTQPIPNTSSEDNLASSQDNYVESEKVQNNILDNTNSPITHNTNSVTNSVTNESPLSLSSDTEPKQPYTEPYVPTEPDIEESSLPIPSSSVAFVAPKPIPVSADKEPKLPKPNFSSRKSSNSQNIGSKSTPKINPSLDSESQFTHNRIPKAMPTSSVGTFWGARLRENESPARPSNRSSEEYSEPQISHSRPNPIPVEIPTRNSTIIDNTTKPLPVTEPSKTTKTSLQSTPVKPLKSSSEEGFLSFIKGVVRKDNEIRDEDDYIPTKPPPPPIEEEEIDEAELAGLPNPIWG